MAYWVAHGALDGFPDEWFLIANMAGTLISVLVLLLRHSQNWDMLALPRSISFSDRAIPQEITSSAAEEREAEELQTLVLVRQAEAGILAD